MKFIKDVYAQGSASSRSEREMLARMDPDARSAYMQTARLSRNGARTATIGGPSGRNVYGSNFRNENRTRTI